MGFRIDLDAVAKNKISHSCRESKTGRPARSLDTILIELNFIPRI